ncbi:hypothetical protein V6N12_031631 [Hibiscus sabdariffa]|uniref:Uncharacterized protein n=1 Tax=Hibiscus sabdariffa TaxID=183260 RepID=A0ABR2DVL3_9ROSI
MKNESSSPKLSIGSRSLTHQEVLVSEPLVRSEIGLNTFLMRNIRRTRTGDPKLRHGDVRQREWRHHGMGGYTTLLVGQVSYMWSTLDEPAANAPRADKDKFKKHMDDMVDVGCLMLATMNSELQKQHENMMIEGSLVGAHVIKMMGYIQTLEKLGFSLKDELATDLILQSLSDSFKPFVLNFNMNEINKTLPQLLGMLRTAEGDMKKDGSKSILVVREAKRKEKKVA